jgi:hypothetical protein
LTKPSQTDLFNSLAVRSATPAGFVGINGRLPSEWVAGFNRNQRPTSSEYAETIERFENKLGDNLSQALESHDLRQLCPAAGQSRADPEEVRRRPDIGHPDVAGIMHLMQLVFGVTGDARS